MKHLALLSTLILLALGASLPPTVRAAEPPVNVLVLSAGDLQPDPQLLTQFAAEGVTLVTRNLADPLSPEMLRQFHVVLIADWEGEGGQGRSFLRSHVEQTLTIQRNTGLLQTYIQDGGGFFFTPLYGNELATESLTRFLAPYGAGVQCAQVRDDAHAFSSVKDSSLAPADYYDYSWTTAIVAHPATRGVQRLYYPTSELRWDDLYSTPVVTLKDPAWTPLVKGMETSRPSRAIDYYNWHTVGTTPPVLTAVRSFGAGRIALFTPNFNYTLKQPFATPKNGWYFENHLGKIEGIVLDKGDGRQPSQGRQLLLGLLRWLAEGARAKGFGNYQAAAFAALPAPAPVPAPGWLYSWQPNDGNQWFKVLVGARSSFSDGQGTIAEYAAAAKSAGVSMLYMTETFEKFTPARWEEFRAACATASDATLKVVAGLDIPDAYGNRYLLLGSPVFPAPSLLSADGKLLAKPQYLCLCFPKGTTVMHRPGSSSVPHELDKQFQGISLFTYRNGVLEDNSFPAYQWEVFRFSNPLPFVVHETYAPADLAKEAGAGYQMLAAADSLDGLSWYLGSHGTSHFWESPVHLQVTQGPIITALGGAIPDPKEPGAHGNLGFTIHSDQPLKEVTLQENYALYRRWLPNTPDFTVNNVKLPEGHVNWALLTATDAQGRTVIAPGVGFGRQIVHTWRCADRQNWWEFPNIYTGTDLAQFDLRVPTADTLEGSGMFPELHGPQRGDNMAALLDFPLASPAAYVQDVALDQRYPRALFDDVAYDAKPSNATARSRVYEAQIRYRKFWVSDEKVKKQTDYLPYYNEVEVSLRRPTQPVGAIFPIVTTLNTKHIQVRGDMSYAYTDPATGQEVTGKLTQGFLDLPKGGRVGGFIALSDGIRVDAAGTVGWAAPQWVNGNLPAGTRWQAAFTAVQPAEAENWRSLLGLRGTPPYKLSFTQGKLQSLAYIANCAAADFGLSGSVDQALNPDLLKGCTSGMINLNKEALGDPIAEYRLPLLVSGINYNWPAALVREGALGAELAVFEGQAYARLDVSKTGAFYVGNVLVSDALNLRLALLNWTADACVVEVNNPTNADLQATIWTAPQVKDRYQGRTKVTVKAGTSQTVRLTAATG
ncbi:MAG TPA: hypothetical protein VGM19_00475 [Armatimonadota bacterium]|jgi:hypothetical protein